MLLLLLVGLAAFLAIFQLWWAVAYWQAYRQVHAPILLVQVAQGLIYAIFFGVVLAAFATNQQMNRLSVVVLMILIVLTTVVWRSMRGPAILAASYPRGSRDVLAFRRPAVDLVRRVRSK
jgi:hypothetical protein